jgi:hypothetical protein
MTGSLPPFSLSWQQAPWDSWCSNFIFQLNACGYSPYVHPLWQEDGSVIYNCCWFSPAQAFSGQSPMGPMTTFYYLKFETPPTWMARSPYLYSPGLEWPGNTPRHWVSISSPMIRRATVEVHRYCLLIYDWTTYIVSRQTHKKRLLLLSRMCVYWPVT